MPPERLPPDDPREWLRLARGDLVIASANLPDAPPELLCFHAQQAAEKAIKAVLIEMRVAFPFTHDLGRLLELVQSDAPADLADAALELTDYASRTRYPFVGEPVTEVDRQAAARAAASVVAWAESKMRGTD